MALDSAIFGLRNAIGVTPDDNNDLMIQARTLYVGGTGDITLNMASGQQVTLKAVPLGAQLALLVNRVLSTGTTATNLVALW